MKTEITLCDLCQSPLAGPGIARTKHGAIIGMGHSNGGWGHRENSVQWSGEICETCYAEYTIIVGAVQLWLRKRKGVRAPTIIIREHNVSIVQEDELQPNGHPPAVLRQLPHVP